MSCIFGVKHSNKIKNETLACWPLKLSVFNYDVIYRSGSEIKGADALSRIYCTNVFAVTPETQMNCVGYMLIFFTQKSIACTILLK